MAAGTAPARRYAAAAVKTLYRASRVRTQSWPEEGDWILVDDRHVERVGLGDPPEAHRVVELPGTTIIPGFVDAHVHLTGTGLVTAGLDLSGSRSAFDLVRLAREWVEGLDPSRRDRPVVGQGWDESGWDVPGLPDAGTLDTIPAPALLIRADGHTSLANAALSEAAELGGLPGFGRDDAGDRTGQLTAEANAAAQKWLFDGLTDAEVELAQLDACGLAAARGVTCVHELSIPDKRGRRDFEVLMRQRERLPAHVVPYFGEVDIPYAMDFGLTRLGGDLFLDGSLGARTAALTDPYADGGGTGLLYHEGDELAELFHNAHLAGMQVGVHAIGDAAIEQAIGVWERVYRALDSRLRRHFRARRHRIEHFELPRGDQIERAAALGLAISVQPNFDAAWGAPGGMYERRLGETRAAGMNPLRSILERGLEVGAGSDSPVTPLDPMATLQAAEAHHDPAQRLSRAEAIRLCTVGAARLAHLDDKKGRLEPGMQADFAAYDRDPFVEPSPEGMRPVLTVSQGRDVYAR